VTYFSGFCLEGESELFSDWLVPGDFAVAGFSLGAIRAFEFTLGSESRIDRLLLFSPAFFQSRPERYLRLQLEAYARDPEGYRRTFLSRCAAPSGRDLSSYSVEGSPEELEFLLRYRWEEEKLRALRDRGVWSGDRSVCGREGQDPGGAEGDRLLRSPGGCPLPLPARGTYSFELRIEN